MVTYFDSLKSDRMSLNLVALRLVYVKAKICLYSSMNSLIFAINFVLLSFPFAFVFVSDTIESVCSQ